MRKKIFIFLGSLILCFVALGFYISRDRVMSSDAAKKNDLSQKIPLPVSDTENNGFGVDDSIQENPERLEIVEVENTPAAPLIDYAPDFSLAHLDRPGEVFTLSDFREVKPVIVDFFAEHCPNCRRNLPKMEALQAQYGDQVEVVLIGIDSEAATRRYLQNRPTTLSLVMQDNVVTRHYGIRFTNTKALINRDGSLHSILHGQDITQQHFLDLIES